LHAALFTLPQPPATMTSHRRGLAVGSAVAMFGAISSWRFAVEDPLAGIGFLYMVPISLLAVVFRIRGGLLGAGVAVALTVMWGETQFEHVSPSGYLVRAFAFAAVAVVVGWQVERRSRFEDEAARWFSLSTDLLCVASFEGRFTRVNPWWMTHLGYSEDDLRGRPYFDFVHPDDLERTRAEAAALAVGPHVTVDFENRYRARDGRWHWLQWSARSDGRQIYAAARDVTERRQLQEELKAVARRDPLTGLSNRRGWDERLAYETARAARSGPLCVAMIDFDGLKQINDERGHEVGDDLLKESAAGWRSAVREVDFLARLGGDEFALLLPDCRQEDAADVVERMRRATPPGATFSAGIAERIGGEPGAELLRRADRALYEAKAAGRNSTVPAVRPRLVGVGGQAPGARPEVHEMPPSALGSRD
jgi:diguanylate cyclase (GGDEF)-like protein/PAS domain S-box-containing protein